MSKWMAKEGSPEYELQVELFTACLDQALKYLRSTIICNYEWRAPRTMVNTSGETFETLPVNHICGENRNGHDQHVCGCGERTTTSQKKQRI
jgi:hypothetical protein